MALLRTASGGKEMWKEFKEFIAKGNVIDLAVGVVIGAAFGKIVTSLVEGLIMPPIGMLLGKVDLVVCSMSLTVPKAYLRHLRMLKQKGFPSLHTASSLTTSLIS